MTIAFLKNRNVILVGPLAETSLETKKQEKEEIMEKFKRSRHLKRKKHASSNIPLDSWPSPLLDFLWLCAQNLTLIYQTKPMQLLFVDSVRYSVKFTVLTPVGSRPLLGDLRMRRVEFLVVGNNVIYLLYRCWVIRQTEYSIIQLKTLFHKEIYAHSNVD